MGSRADASRRWLARFSLPAIATLVLLPFLWKLDGQSHADWQQLIGRFHPLAVHLPIGMLLLIPLLEIRGLSHPALREAAGFILGLSVLATLGTVALGYLLAYGSGTTGVTVTYHMWGGISLAIGVLVCFLIRPGWVAGEFPLGYPISLACVLLLLLWTCHQGGSLTHGENYLTEWLPDELKTWAGIKNEPVKEQLVADSFYALQIRPILDANCYSCHSQTKVKGGLRLDSYARLMRGGRSGAVIVPGRPDQSSLFKRITLPPDDKKFMPSDGKPPLKPEQIAWIKAWIAAGASDAATTVAGVTLRRKPVSLRPVGDYSGLASQIAELEKTQSISLVPVSRNSGDGLILQTISGGRKFNDAQLAQLAKFGPYIVEAKLGHTSVTDACFDTLATFTNLRALHLEDTAITGQGLAKLNSLSQLTYLNLTGTKVTGASVAVLASMKNLEHVYLYNTAAQPAAPPAKGTPKL